jgi:hypothetical protein
MRQPCRPPKPDRRRALELLAACRDGFTEGLMFANGFTAELSPASKAATVMIPIVFSVPEDPELAAGLGL